MGNKNQVEFNKLKVFDDFIVAMTLPPNAKPSESIQSIINGQNFLQKIHDEAFSEGFEKGLEATDKVDKL